LKHFTQHQNYNSILQIFFTANFKVTENFFFPSNISVTVAPLAMHLPAPYTTLPSYQGPKKPSPQTPQYLHNTDFPNIL